MKNLNKIMRLISLLTCTLLISTACDDDLILDPISSISSSSFWKNEGHAQSAIVGMHFKMLEVSNLLREYGELRADHVDDGVVSVGSPVHLNILTPDNHDGAADWSKIYALINDANLILKNVPLIDFDENQKNDVLAQAYFMRAWAYFLAVRLWGDVPLLTDGFESPIQEGLFPDRTAKASVLNQITSDVNESLRLFSSNAIPSRIFASQPAANALKAEVHLWLAKMEGGGSEALSTALTAVNAVLASPDVGFESDYESIFRNRETSEDILSGHWDINETNMSHWAAYFNIRLTQVPANLVDSVPHAGETGTSFYSPSERLRTQIADNAALGNSMKDARGDVIFFDFNDNSGNKITILNKFIGTVNSGTRRIDDNIKIYRTGDIYLMKAEILNAQGEVNEAIIELNMTRNRAGVGSYAGAITKEALDEAILLERGIELAFEGKRWFDLLRFDKTFELVPSLIGRENEVQVLWPIARGTIGQNPKITQNNGY